jgi:uncharacterized protein (DUF2141 family)
MLVILIFLLIQTSFALNLNNDQNKEGSLRVIITGFANDEGNCRFALDNTEYVYESEDSVFIGKVLPIINNTVVIKIDSLQYGYYAVKVFHDENRNEEIDTNFLGIPTEDYGYSNNASAWFGPPSWENARFLFDKKDMTLEISVD